MSYDATNRSVESLAGLSQSVAVLRLMQEAGFSILQKRTGEEVKEQVSLDWLADAILRKQRQDK